ncbi:MAG: DUF5979 domain-containing protein, partial [Actinomycetaceae bacterium]|nr:DUF5979 domain-containing protein [Actinomycetaceae bacterium]
MSGSPAVAADQDITVTPVSAVYTDGITDFPNRQLNIGAKAVLAFNWDAANKSGFGSGDKFVINLGEFFNNVEVKKLPMSIPVNGVSTEVATCDIQKKVVTCTFGPNVDTLKAGGFEQWSGALSLTVNVEKGTDQPKVNVGVNGEDTPVTLPVGPNGAVGIKAAEIVPASVYKAASVKEGQKFGDYTIYMSGIRLKGHLGDAFNYDDPSQVVTFRDSLVNAQGEIDGGQVFRTKPHPTDPDKLVPADPENWIFRAVKLEANAKSYRIDSANPGADDNKTGETPAEIGSFELSVEFNKATPHIATINVKGPFSASYTYSISYQTDLLNPKGIQEGTVYSNRIDLEGSNHSFQLNRAYRNSAKATAQAVPGFGTFAIEKRVFGAAEGLIENTHTVNVNYTYELPLEADAYQDWTAPGTLNADKKTGKASCIINFRKTTVCLAAGQNPGKLLPKGTKVFITPADEDLASISEAVRDLKWAEPIVAFDNNATFMLIGENGNLPQVTITNKANLKVGKFKVKKTVTGLDAGVQAGPFAFSYSCVKDNNPAVLGRIAGVTANGEAVESDKAFPLGSVCTVTEEQPAAVAGYTLQMPQEQQVTVDSETVAKEVVFNNAYTKDMGTFSIKKTVTGLPDRPEPYRFNFTYTCVKDNQPELTGDITDVPANGTEFASNVNVPVGYECTIRETQPAPIEGYELQGPAPKTVTIGAAGTPTPVAEFANVYTKVVAPFAVKKTVTGLDANVNAGPFDFTYSCVKDNGTPVTGEITGVEAGKPAKATD